MPFPNFAGRTKVWTREKVAAALRTAATEIKSQLPTSDRAWGEIKRGRYDWPPASRILQYYHGLPKAWLAVGANPKRVNLLFSRWTKEEDEYLLDHAGGSTLAAIAAHLGRTYPATRARLNKKFGIRSRENQGYLSAAELSKEYQCPYHRVRRALVAGTIKGRFDCRRNRWEVELNALTPEAKLILTKPRGSWKDGAPDLGDYYQRHGLRRKNIDGRVSVVAE